MRSIFGRRRIRGGLTAFFVLVAFFVAPALAGAATFTVNTTADNPPGPGECEGVAGDCSLRQAIDMANGEPGADTVVLPAGHYGLTIEQTGGTPGDSGDLNAQGELTIEGAGARKSVIDASAIEARVIEFEDGGVLKLVNLGVTGGNTEGAGGGIYSENGELTLEGVAVTDNESFNEGYGGGVSVEEGMVTILDSVLSDNRNSGDGGGLYYDGNETVRIENSTIANNLVNTALFPAGPYWGAYGGGVEAYGQKLILKNSTIAGNQIIDGNGGEEGRGAAFDGDFSEYEVVNTIIADNTGSEVEEPGQCTETFESLGHNMETQEPEGEVRCFEAASDLIADPLLGELANNGGETDTMALPVGSPAVDAGDSALCLPTDQRGVARPVGNGCDIGAFEYAAPPPAPPKTTTTTPSAPPVVGGWFGIKKIEHNRKKGTARLLIKFTGSGQATLSGKGVKTASKAVSTGMNKLAIVPTGSVKAKLEQTGKVKVKMNVTFKTAGNTWAKPKSLAVWLTM